MTAPKDRNLFILKRYNKNSMEDINIDMMQLGGNIQLIGFKELDPAKLIVVKKVVGNYVRKIEEKTHQFEKIAIHMKKIHNSEYEIQTKTIVDGKPYNSELTDYNLFVALDKTLSKVLEEITHL